MAWKKYKDASFHPELKSNKKYCVKTCEDFECYARFTVYDGGQECDFISLNDNRPLLVTEFRLLNKNLDLQ